jgi:hypothetical protein
MSVRQMKKPEVVFAPPDIERRIRALRPAGIEPRLEFSMPMRVISEANERDSYMARYRRKKAQQEETHVEWLRAARGVEIPLPCVVRLIRIGPRALDSDNLASGFKACRDQIAREIGVDDGSDQIRFEYAQVAIGRQMYGVKVEVYQMEDVA